MLVFQRLKIAASTRRSTFGREGVGTRYQEPCFIGCGLCGKSASVHPGVVNVGAVCETTEHKANREEDVERIAVEGIHRAPLRPSMSRTSAYRISRVESLTMRSSA